MSLKQKHAKYKSCTWYAICSNIIAVACDTGSNFDFLSEKKNIKSDRKEEGPDDTSFGSWLNRQGERNDTGWDS